MCTCVGCLCWLLCCLLCCADGLMYSTTECAHEFKMGSEDVRVVGMVHKEVEARRSSRASVVLNVRVIVVDKKCMHKLQHGCWKPIDQ